MLLNLLLIFCLLLIRAIIFFFLVFLILLCLFIQIETLQGSWRLLRWSHPTMGLMLSTYFIIILTLIFSYSYSFVNVVIFIGWICSGLSDLGCGSRGCSRLDYGRNKCGLTAIGLVLGNVVSIRVQTEGSQSTRILKDVLVISLAPALFYLLKLIDKKIMMRIYKIFVR